MAIAAIVALAGCSPVPLQEPLALFFGGPPVATYGELAVELRAGERQIQALDQIVAKVHLELTGTNVPGTASVDVTRAQFENDKAIVRFSELLPGPITVKAQIFDSGSRQVASAAGSATINAGQQSTLLMQIVPASGSAIVTVDGALESTPSVTIL
jgi:hypothetical protein